jgi:poly(3-hydroxybutyrate) depolymerase
MPRRTTIASSDASPNRGCTRQSDYSRHMTARVLAACLILALAVPVARAQTPQPTYVQFDPFTVKGALYRPDPSRERDTAVLLIHGVNNYLNHLAGWELANRGFMVLAMNSRFDNNEASVIWEVIAQDVRTEVDYLPVLGIANIAKIANIANIPMHCSNSSSRWSNL